MNCKGFFSRKYSPTLLFLRRLSASYGHDDVICLSLNESSDKAIFSRPDRWARSIHVLLSAGDDQAMTESKTSLLKRVWSTRSIDLWSLVSFSISCKVIHWGGSVNHQRGSGRRKDVEQLWWLHVEQMIRPLRTRIAKWSDQQEDMSDVECIKQIHRPVLIESRWRLIDCGSWCEK
jgi:hypothetical protein